MWYLLVHLGLIVLLVGLITLKVTGWPLLMLPLGILMVFLFTLMHETIHRTAFKTRLLNDVISTGCGWVLCLPPQWFKYFHFQHHRHTQDPEKDPELMSGKPGNLKAYLWHLTGIPVAFGQLKVLVNNARGVVDNAFVPEVATSRVVRESRVMILTYLLVVALAGYTGLLEWLLYCWIIPLLVGQPFLRLYLMAEHGRCPMVESMFANTRTVFTHRLICRLAWNMPYHAEHHAYPSVPFHLLPAFHQLVKNELQITSNGYADFHRETLRSHLNTQAER